MQLAWKFAPIFAKGKIVAGENTSNGNHLDCNK
jgi:hypothetical protein